MVEHWGFIAYFSFVACINIVSVSALAPTLTINEQLAELGQDFNATNMRTLTLTLNTSALLYANITIHVKGMQAILLHV